MGFIEWVTALPGAQDPDDNSNQPDLLNDPQALPAPAGRGNNTRVSQIHTLRKIAHYLAKTVGDAGSLPAGCLLDRVTALEAGAGDATELQGRPISAGTPSDKEALMWDAGLAEWGPAYPTTGIPVPITQQVHAGFTGSGFAQTTAAVQTTDATETTLFALPLAAAAAYWLEAKVVARAADGSARLVAQVLVPVTTWRPGDSVEAVCPVSVGMVHLM